MTPLPLRFVVRDLDAGIRFYSAMFARAPAELKPGCARWTVGRFGASVTVLARRPSCGRWHRAVGSRRHSPPQVAS